jgi:hypothetical protein
MKSLRQIVELKKIDLVPDPEAQAGTVSDYANPKSEAEKRFVAKHMDSVQKTSHPAYDDQAEQDAVFQGANKQKDMTHDNAGAGHYKDGEDAAVYEAAEQAVDFVRENLTDENLSAFDKLLDEQPEAAVEFALSTVNEIAGDEDNG